MESIDKSLEATELEQLIRQGAERIFAEDDSSAVITKAMVDTLVDREHYLEQQREERKKAAEEGTGDKEPASWLSAFRASLSLGAGTKSRRLFL